MSASDWEEVKRLAADFQRAQLTSTSQKLTERNWIEIVSKLIEDKQIEVFFTTDGKEYITPKHLLKELVDELFVHGGRLNLVEAAKLLTIDLSVLKSKALELEKNDPKIRVINGELLDEEYIKTISEEINERLYHYGQITIGELTGQYDLPTDFLLKVVEKHLGKEINGIQDKQDCLMFYTDAFIERNLCITRGALIGLTKPTSVASIISACGIQERLFFSVIDSLIQRKEVPGSLTGRQGGSSMFIPLIYTKAQSEWVTNFFNQNGYLELNNISRLGISDPVSYIKRNFQNSNIVMLDSFAVGTVLLEQVEGAVDDIIANASFDSVLHFLPSVFDKKDIEIILKQILKKKSSQNLITFDTTFVFTETYLKGLLKLFNEVIQKNAQSFVSSGGYMKAFTNQNKMQNNKNNMEDDKYDRKEERRRKGDNFEDEKIDRKEERRKKASTGKGGGGTQGRETRTKSTKNKYLKVRDDGEEDNNEVKSNEKIEIISLSEVQKVLNSVQLLQEQESEELIEEMALYFHPTLNKNALEAAKTIFETTLASSNQDRRKKYNDLQEKLNELVLNIRLFEKGYKNFPSKDVQQQLAKYLLKSVCTDVTNDVFSYIAQENAQLEGKEMTNELRMKVVSDLPNNMKQPLLALHNSLNASSVDDFLNAIEPAIGPGLCDIILKKPDKKKERPHLLDHRQQLIEQLNVTEDPALVLHLAILIIFQGVTQTMLHASGRFVSTILTFLQEHLPAEEFNILQRYHDLVLKILTTSESDEKANAQKMLQEDMSKVKEIALMFKKGTKNSGQVV